MNRVVVKSRVGPDGILNMTVPIGTADANREVEVIIEPVTSQPVSREKWLEFIASTSGAWQGAFECPEQGEYEQRDTL
jgi:hypothetical protein